jgi:hypothetical protein
LIEFDNEVTKKVYECLRIFLQALHADKRLKELGKQGRIIIKTSDADVTVLCIYFDATSLSGSPKLSKSWKSDAASFSILYTNVLPFLKKEEETSSKTCYRSRCKSG